MAGHDVDPDAMWKPGYVAADPAPPWDGPSGLVDVSAPSAPSEPRVVPAEPPAAPPDEPQVEAVPASPWSRLAPHGDDGLELFVPAGTEPAMPAGSDRSSRRWLAVAAVAVVVALGAGALVVARADHGDRPPDSSLPAIAGQADVRWSQTMANGVVDVVSLDGLVVLADAGSDSSPVAQIVALDAHDGTLRWTSHLGRQGALGELLVVDGHLIVTTGGRIPTVRELDPATGEARWRRRIRASDAVGAVYDSLFLLRSGQRGMQFDALDLATGTTTGTVADGASFGPAGAVIVDGDEADVYDRALRLVQDDVDLGAAPIDAALVGDVVVMSVPGELRAVELTGRERWRQPIDPGDARYLLPSGGQEGQVLVVSTSSMRAVDVRGAEPVTRWEVEALPVINPAQPGMRWVPVQRSPGSGELQVLDLEDGSLDATLDTEAFTPGDTLFGADGAILVRTDPADVARQLVAVDYARGTTRWQTTVEGAPVLVEHGVVGIDPTADGTTISYVGDG